MTDFADSTVLVTGAGGFIGSHLVERLVVEGARVRALVRYNSRNEWGNLDLLAREITDEVDVVLGDLRDIESVAVAVKDRDYVFHLAAQIAIPYSYVNPRDFFETNVMGSLNVARAALEAGVRRVVHTSTSEVYGSAQIIPMTEDHPLNPQSPYAASKVGADKLMDAFHCSHDLPVTVLRPFNTYGPRQSARAIVPTIISQALGDVAVKLGSLSPRRDLTYVDDTVAGFLAAASAPKAIGSTVQLGTGRDVSVGDIVELVGELLGRHLDVELDHARLRPVKSEVTRLIASPRFAAELMGWAPHVDLREGLGRTVAYISNNLGHYRAKQYVV